MSALEVASCLREVASITSAPAVTKLSRSIGRNGLPMMLQPGQNTTTAELTFSAAHNLLSANSLEFKVAKRSLH